MGGYRTMRAALFQEGVFFSTCRRLSGRMCGHRGGLSTGLIGRLVRWTRGGRGGPLCGLHGGLTRGLLRWMPRGPTNRLIIFHWH